MQALTRIQMKSTHTCRLCFTEEVDNYKSTSSETNINKYIHPHIQQNDSMGLSRLQMSRFVYTVQIDAFAVNSTHMCCFTPLFSLFPLSLPPIYLSTSPHTLTLTYTLTHTPPHTNNNNTHSPLPIHILSPTHTHTQTHTTHTFFIEVNPTGSFQPSDVDSTSPSRVHFMANSTQ